MAITAIPVSIGVLIQLSKLHNPPGRMITAAAIIDNIPILIPLALSMGIMTTGQIPDFLTFINLMIHILIFFMFTFFVVKIIVPCVGH